MKEEKLKEYHLKRQFDKTTEPEGQVRKFPGPPRFVIQKHAATRLHYDLRLEHKGVLLSWAVPKMPSLDPKVKRLAIHVEDHPVDYFDFEGVIPKGNYGAGTVMVWDKGTYSVPGTENKAETEKKISSGLYRGRLSFFLNGEKLKGNFSLVRTHSSNGKEHWLFFKTEDEYAKTGNDIPDEDHSVISGRKMEDIAKEKSAVWISDNKIGDIKASQLKGAVKSPFPERVEPMLAKLGDEPFNHPEWLFELKLDGYRTIAVIKEGDVKLYSRRGKLVNKTYPSIVDGLKKEPYNIVLDGEIVVKNKAGKIDFQLLQNYGKQEEGTLEYHVFDVLYFHQYDLRNVPLLQRKKILKLLLPEFDSIFYCEHQQEKGVDFYNKVKSEGLEGIMAKKADSIYKPGTRTGNWLKIKVVNRQEAVIGGYTQPSGGRKHFGALLLGVYENGKLRYTGKVGTGFNDLLLEEFSRKMKPLERKTSPFDLNPPKEKNATWLSPKLIGEVKFWEWTEGGHMRHPSFVGLRDDKKPAEIEKIEPESVEEVMQEEAPPKEPRFTNLDKIYFPEENIKKGDVIEYYRKIAQYILPHLRDRPQSMRRNPNGIGKKSFFQKNVKGKVPSWIETFSIYSESQDEDYEYLLCQNKETLLFMANWGCIELNPWNSRVQHPDNPDYIIFDLDPVGIGFDKLVEVALQIKAFLDQYEVPLYIKTSGGKGMHLFIPSGAKYNYEQAQNFSKLISVMIHHQMPETTSLERMPGKRQGKVYLDYLQNGRGKTMASVYSLRPKPGAPVSMPLRWEQVHTKLNPADFNIHAVPEILEAQGDIWKGMDKEKEIDIAKTLERMDLG